MFFRRKVYEQLLDWKKLDQGRTAVLIEGARRVGKTTITKQFAASEYRSFIFLDFHDMDKDTRELFDNDANDLNYFFQRLQLLYGVRLYERESVIIFDEVQNHPSARQLIRRLVEDHRYDYIETGSLISLKQNVRNIRIPSEEHRVEMHPMDFEEWLWANGDDVTADILKDMFDSRSPLGPLHKEVMRKFRTYMIVGGMPQVVDEFLKTGDVMMAERRKRDILDLYREDMMKLKSPTGIRAQAVLDGIPSLLSSRKKVFSPGRIMKGARSRDFVEAMTWLAEAKLVNPCDLCNDPDVTMNLTRDRSRRKLYLLDTGLLISLAFGKNRPGLRQTYDGLLSGKLSINEGMFFENSVAQQLVASGRDLLFYEFREGDSQLYEIDFLIPGTKGIIPLEVKSSVSSKHVSLDNFVRKFGSRVEFSYVIHGKDLRVDDKVVYVPIYMTMFL